MKARIHDQRFSSRPISNGDQSVPRKHLPMKMKKSNNQPLDLRELAGAFGTCLDPESSWEERGRAMSEIATKVRVNSSVQLERFIHNDFSDKEKASRLARMGQAALDLGDQSLAVYCFGAAWRFVPSAYHERRYLGVFRDISPDIYPALKKEPDRLLPKLGWYKRYTFMQFVNGEVPWPG